MNAHFLEHPHDFAFAMTCCLQKEKVGKKKVLGGSSCDNFFFQAVLLTSSSITINLQIKLSSKIMNSA